MAERDTSARYTQPDDTRSIARSALSPAVIVRGVGWRKRCGLERSIVADIGVTSWSEESAVRSPIFVRAICRVCEQRVPLRQ